MLVSISLTCRDKKEARKIAKALLAKKLIACANIVLVDSLYWWKKKIVDEKEALMLIKTTVPKKNRTIQEIKKLHSYNVVGITVEKAETTKECLNWAKNI